jgi:CRP-like cAMP-binding protein
VKYLASLFEIKVFPKGEILFYEGAPRDKFFLIIKGELEISKNKMADKRRLIRLSSSDFVGEGLFLDNLHHSTDAEALTDIEVLVSTKAKLQTLKKERHVLFNALMEAIARQLSKRLQFSASIVSGIEQIYPLRRFRLEHDLLGELNVPDYACYGIQTLRAVENFAITGIPISHFPSLIIALAMVKKGAALTNFPSFVFKLKASGSVVHNADGS